jgi:hypothetical protein
MQVMGMWLWTLLILCGLTAQGSSSLQWAGSDTLVRTEPVVDSLRLISGPVSTGDLTKYEELGRYRVMRTTTTGCVGVVELPSQLLAIRSHTTNCTRFKVRLLLIFGVKPSSSSPLQVTSRHELSEAQDDDVSSTLQQLFINETVPSRERCHLLPTKLL